MEMLTASSTLLPLPTKLQRRIPPPLTKTFITTTPSLLRSTKFLLLAVSASSATDNEKGRNLGVVEEEKERRETLLYSVAPYPLLLPALLPGGE